MAQSIFLDHNKASLQQPHSAHARCLDLPQFYNLSNNERALARPPEAHACIYAQLFPKYERGKDFHIIKIYFLLNIPSLLTG